MLILKFQNWKIWFFRNNVGKNSRHRRGDTRITNTAKSQSTNGVPRGRNNRRGNRRIRRRGVRGMFFFERVLKFSNKIFSKSRRAKFINNTHIPLIQKSTPTSSTSYSVILNVVSIPCLPSDTASEGTLQMTKPRRRWSLQSSLNTRFHFIFYLLIKQCQQ